VKNINSSEIGRLEFPLPPFAEQHRIVARVEDLRALCAELRETLTIARTVQSELADALVAEVA
jgi:type I restriction enzyme S subunit